MSKGKAAAFFDFDKTLLAKESAELGLKYIWKQKKVSPLYLLRVFLAGKLYELNILSPRFMTGLVLSYYKGRRLQDFVDGTPEFYQEWIKPWLSPTVLGKVEEHREKGHVLVLLSASVDYILQVVADNLGFDHLFCSKLEVDENGICTGKTNGPVLLGGNKMITASAFALRDGIDLDASYVYTDHHSDLPLLESVGNPVAVRPTKPLRKIAVERQWPIIDDM